MGEGREEEEKGRENIQTSKNYALIDESIDFIIYFLKIDNESIDR